MANEEGKGGNPKEIAKAMAEAKAASESVTASFENQLKIIMQMRDAMNQVAKSMQALCEQDCAGMSPEKWGEVSKAVEKTGTTTNDTTAAVQKMSDVMKSKWTKSIAVGAIALDGLVQGLRNFAALSKAGIGVITGFVGGLGSIAASIIAIPFKMITGLFDMAQKGGGGNELAAAYEEVRKEFGSLKSESAKAIIDTAVNMDKMNETGISSYRVFGNAAERLKAVKEMAVGMGAAFQVFGPEVEKNGTAIMMYNKGLGITSEQMSSIASNAMRMGKGIADVQLDMTKQALGMSKAFGVNAKVISKDMGKAMQDLAHFGHLSTKELAVAATFANKLGISVDKLTGIMDATATFDQAAEGMSKLNEQFHTNIDATEIMSAQNPAEKVEILRKEFAKTGKDMASMSYQERMLIKQTTGLGDEALNAAFSVKNAGVSLDKMSSQSDKNEKKTMTQAEAMHELADSIERLTPSGGGAGGGLLNHLFEGFRRGIMGSKEFITLMMNLRQILMKATFAGVELGKKFVEIFPGVKDIFRSLAEVFDPKKFDKLFTGIKKSFDVFGVGGTKSMEDFMKKINKSFTDFFDMEKPAGKKVIEGFKTFFKALFAIIGSAIKWLVPEITSGLKKLTEIIRNPKELLMGAGSAASTGKSFMLEILSPLINAVNDPAMWKDLWAAFSDFSEIIWKKLKHALLSTKVGQEIITGIVTLLFGRQMLTMAPMILSKFLPQLVSLLSTGIGSAVASIGGIALAGAALVNVNKKLDQFENRIDERKDATSRKIGAYGASLLQGLTLGLVPDDVAVILGNKFAELADLIFQSIQSKMGGPFTNKLKSFFSADINFLSSVGGLIGAIFSGDSSKISDAAAQVGDNLVKVASAAFEFLLTELPKLFVKITSILDTVIGSMLEGFGSALIKLSDKLGFFGAGIKGVGILIMGLGGVLQDLGKFFGNVFEKIKSFDLGKMIDDQMYGFKQNLIGAANWVLDNVPGPILTMLGLNEKGRAEMRASLNKNAADLRANFLERNKIALEAQKDAARQSAAPAPKIPEASEASQKKLQQITTTQANLQIPTSTVPAGAVSGTISAIAEIGNAADAAKGVAEKINDFTKESQAIAEALSRLPDAMKPITTSVAKLGVIFTTGVKFNETTRNLIELLKSLDELGTIGTKFSKEEIGNKILKFNESMGTEASGLGFHLGCLPTHFAPIVADIKKIVAAIPAETSKTATEAVTNLNNLLGSIDNLGDAGSRLVEGNISDKISKLNIALGDKSSGLGLQLSEMPGHLDPIFKALASNTIANYPIAAAQNAIKIFEKAVATIQQLDNALSGLPKIDISAKMAETAGKLGLGSSGIYSVKSKEVVVNIELNVSMDVDKVEQVIISRHNSIIRDRINYAIEKGGAQEPASSTAKIKSTGPQTGFPGRQFGT